MEFIALTFAALAALPRYRSKFEGTRCACCKGNVAMGEVIVKLSPEFNQLFRDLAFMTTKVFKYVHETCLPVELPETQSTVVRGACDQLMAITDPNWPLDYKGFNKADAGPMQRWIRSGYNPLFAHSMGQRLVKYIDTQLGAELGEQIRAAVAYGDNLIAQRAVKAPEVPEVKAAPSPAPKPTPRPVMIDVKGGTVIVSLDPPWTNPAHAVIKDRVKACGARYDGATRTWTMGLGIFRAVLPKLFGDTAYQLSGDAERALAS